MKVSIAIPTYVKNNIGVDYLQECFVSIEKQTFKDYEVIVSDHSKINDVVDLCEEYSKKFNLKYLRNFYGREVSHPGTTNSNNVMKYCIGKYIKILHCDDFFVDNQALEKIVDALDKTQKQWLACGFNHTLDGINFFNSRQPKYPDHLLIGNNLLGAPTNITIRNDCKVDYDENLTMGMDIDWYHQLRMKYGLPVLLDDILVTSRIRNDRVSSEASSQFDITINADGSSWQYIKSELEYLQKKHKDFFDTWVYPNG